MTMALAPGWPNTEMPYSVSVPITRRTLMQKAYPGGPNRRLSEVLPGVGHRVDGASGFGALLARDQRPDIDDPLALLAGDPRPVVGVGGVRQVLVLAELVHAGGQEVGDPQPLDVGVEELLDRHLLGSVHDVLDHRARVEVLEVEHFLVAVGVRDLQEAVLLGLA